VKREERELILKQGVVAPVTPRQRRELEALHEDLQDAGLQGRALNLRLRNFRPSADGYLAALGGPLPYMVRLRTVSEMTHDHERQLEAAWHELAASEVGAEAFATAWRAQVEAWRFDEVNDLIDRHNRFYPAESRLPMDPKTRDYALVGGEDYRRRHLDAAWALERCPASLEQARGAAEALRGAACAYPAPT
jgi:hypothetical protein